MLLTIPWHLVIKYDYIGVSSGGHQALRFQLGPIDETYTTQLIKGKPIVTFYYTVASISMRLWSSSKYPDIVGWNLIATEIGDANALWRVCYYTSCGAYDLYSSGTNGYLTGSTDYYFGCKTCSDTSVSYIIHSFNVKYQGWCVSVVLSSAPTNSK